MRHADKVALQFVLPALSSVRELAHALFLLVRFSLWGFFAISTADFLQSLKLQITGHGFRLKGVWTYSRSGSESFFGVRVGRDTFLFGKMFSSRKGRFSLRPVKARFDNLGTPDRGVQWALAISPRPPFLSKSIFCSDAFT